MRLVRCDQCRRESGAVLPNHADEDCPTFRWVQLAKHECLPHEQCGSGCAHLELCSWKCVADYAAARNVIQGELPSI
jgi:hypothetical protein